jgi:hypothetical protein
VYLVLFLPVLTVASRWGIKISCLAIIITSQGVSEVTALCRERRHSCLLVDVILRRAVLSYGTAVLSRLRTDGPLNYSLQDNERFYFSFFLQMLEMNL